MFKSWVSPEPETTTTSSFREYVQQLHNKIIEPGTGVTHVTEVPDQFDFESELLPNMRTSSSYGAGTKPLIYKFTGVSGYSVYIKVQYYLGASSTSRTSYGCLISRVGVWNTLEACISEHSPHTYCLTHAPYYRASTTTRYKDLESIIYTNGDTLAIISSVGYEGLNYKDSWSFSPMYVIVRVLKGGFVRMVNNPHVPSENTTSSTPSLNNVDHRMYNIFVEHSGEVDISQNTTININVSSIKSIVPLTFEYIKGGMDVYEGLYIYNRTYITDYGISPINSTNYWMSADKLQHYNLQGDYTSFAILAE